MDLVGIREFAKRKGVSHTLVGRALKNGRIKYHEDSGKIDWDTQATAFDNNCNLKFKMAARTKGDLARAAMAGVVSAPSYIPKPPPPPKEPKRIGRPPKPKPEPEPTPVPPVPETPVPEIPEVRIPRKPKIVKASKDDLTPEQLADQEAERAASRDRDNYFKARTAEQVLKAQLLDLELKQKKKELMPVLDARKAVQKMAEFVKKGIDSVADRICDELAGMHDPHEIHALLTKEHNNVLKELSDAASGFAS